MSFNLFGQTTVDDIKVGYVDPNLGYVDDISICEANSYAKDNPGTTFIFVDGSNSIRYLNINEVNRLTPADLIPSNEKCGGIQNYTGCNPTIIEFSGGGGIGAVGNPVIGKDGSLLAVDLVSGGHGYQYPPFVSAKDNCQNGNGSVLVAVLGETVDQIEVYEGEEDFEDYEICDDIEIGYGLKYGNDGEELGEWEPGYYTEINADPIEREIEQFQSALKNPFWTTRETQPDRITVLGQQYATQETTNVTYPAWGEFMNKYAISPVQPSDTLGTDEAGKVFSIEWELNFPITGEYIFRGVCDNLGQVFVDNGLVGDLKEFDQNPSPLQKTVSEGNHIVRVDLVNAPVVEKVKLATENTNNVDVTFKITGDGRNTNKMKFSFVSDDYSFTLKGNAGSGQSRKVTINLNPNKKFKIYASSTKDGGVEQGIVKNGTKNREGGVGESDRIFADHIQSDNDNDDLQITANIGSFRASNRKKQSNGRTTFDLEFSVGGGTSSTSLIGEVISPKSWNQNPMGVSMLIEAPKPPVPQEELPIQEGECPPNPIWTTRFPGSEQQWYPVKNEIWAGFLNRYAISPVLPLDTPGSDGSGVIHRNSWPFEAPYRGYYKFQVQRDNTARIYVDGNLAFDVTTSGDEKWIKEGLVNKVKSQKVFLEKGAHTISVELENTPQDIDSIIEKKIFSTQDWRVSTTEEPDNNSKIKANFVLQGSNVYLQVDGSGTGEISFVMDVNDNPSNAGLAAKEVIIPSDSGKLRFTRESSGVDVVFSEGSRQVQTGQDRLLSGSGYTEYETIKQKGKFTAGKKYGPIQIIGAGAGARGPILNSKKRLGLRDADGDDENIKITIVNIKSNATTTTTAVSQSPTKNGITYDGPTLFGHIDTRWSQYMNDFSVSPKVFNSIGESDNRVVGKYTLTWKNVNFPESGTYKFNFQADNIAKLKIGGTNIIETSEFAGNKLQYTFNITAGNYDIVIELQNLKSGQGKGKNDFIFARNPMGVALYISKDIVFSESNKTSWVQNPMGISAILVPPPCAKKIGGKGVVTDVNIIEPGNGYPQSTDPGYPVVLVLDSVEVENPGINYSDTDVIKVTPDIGAVLEPVFGPFGTITSVNVLNPGGPVTVYPSITVVPSVPQPGTPGTPSTGTFGTSQAPTPNQLNSITQPTGVNAKFRPVFRVVRDPVQLLEDQQIRQEQLIQVTDLVGLKQTGYVDGRAYYGAVYYDQGIPYAGYYKTAGTQVRVYNTLQESITANVTTRPSAIQRSGTDISSNDPRLNIPGTPQSTTEQ